MRGGRGRRATGLEAQESVFLILEEGKGEVLVFWGFCILLHQKKKGGGKEITTRE